MTTKLKKAWNFSYRKAHPAFSVFAVYFASQPRLAYDIVTRIEKKKKKTKKKMKNKEKYAKKKV